MAEYPRRSNAELIQAREFVLTFYRPLLSTERIQCQNIILQKPLRPSETLWHTASLQMWLPVLRVATATSVTAAADHVSVESDAFA